MKLATALLVALAAAAPALAQNCVSSDVKVSDSGAKSAKPVNYSTAFDLDGADQHFQSLVPIDDFRWNTKTTFSCVDSRGEQNELGTPGGDIAELAGAIAVFFNQTGQNVTDDAVDELFKYVAPKIATKERPFYFHTSDEKLVKIFHYLEENFVESGAIKKRPTVFPERMPSDKAAADAWLDGLTIGKHQGCGHMRLMIDQFADYGLDSDAVPKALIKAFFNYWWSTAPKSTERGIMKLVVVQGPLTGSAVAIVTSDGCPGRSPAVPPSHDGSQLFVYHAQAVDEFRKLAITPVLADYAKSKGLKLDPTAFYNALKDLQGKMLGATLTYLAPANALPLYNVQINAQKTEAMPQNTNADAPAPGRDLTNTKNVASNYQNIPGYNSPPAKAPAKTPAKAPAKAPAPAPKSAPHNAPHNKAPAKSG